MTEWTAVDTVDCGITSDAALTLIGPMPPPIHGQSVAMSHMVSELEPHFTRMRITDIGERRADSRFGHVIRLGRSVSALRSIPGSDAVYIAVKAGHGMWLTTAAAGLARMTGARLVLHHHSYAYVRKRTARMAALARAAGPRAHHIVLTTSMANDLRIVMPTIGRLMVMNNAGLVEKGLLELPLKADGAEMVLGHLSNLSLDKGIAEVVDLAVALHRAGARTRLVVAGPTADGESRTHLDRARRELGPLFEYRGPVAGKSKLGFFEEITHFVFPSRYVHEAAPLVVYEALAAGTVCVATRRGSIPDQLEGSRGILARTADSFVEETLPVLAEAAVSTAVSQESRQVYLRALAQSQAQLTCLIKLLAGDGEDSTPPH